jgi:phosphate starvation-inducible PhoH-like protein
LSDRSSRILTPAAGGSVTLRFEDNALVQALCGQHDQHLARIEQQLGVHLVPRGNEILVTGPGDAPAVAEAALTALYARLQRGLEVGPAEVDAALRMAPGGGGIAEYNSDELAIRTRRHSIAPRSPNQAAYIRALRNVDLVFAYGPAGTGKTYLAVAVAVGMLLDGEIDRIILSRPAVEAGERLGFLPGDLREKVDPYLRPLYDALHDMLPPQRVAKSLQTGEIEIAPLAFMRGRTLANAFVILDEAQNATPLQLKMFLTRLGENSRMAVTGDISQVDLPPGQRSGLSDAMRILNGVDGVRVVRFTDMDVVRHPLVTRIVRAYDAAEAAAAERRADKRGDDEPPGDAMPGTADDGR